MKGEDLRWKKSSSGKSDAEKKIDEWLGNLKSTYDVSEYQSKEIPILYLKNEITHLPIYIDDECRIRDSFEIYTNNAAETVKKIDEWVENNEIEYDVWLMSGYSKPFQKVCLLSDKQLKQRGVMLHCYS